MKKILLTLILCAVAAPGFYALTRIANRERRELRETQAALLEQTQKLGQVQEEIVALTAKLNELKQVERAARPIDPALVGPLLDGDLKSAATQRKLLAELGGSASTDWVIVSKAALAKATFRPLKTFPEGEKLSDAARKALAITSEEQRAVEAAFAEALNAVGEWAKAHVQREGPSEEMLVRYTLPTDPAFEQALTNRLFSTIDAAVGNERGDLIEKFFLNWRLYEDGAIAERTNIFSIHRISGAPGFGERSGWRWGNSEAINTYPEPIKSDRFPYAFRFVFPGGWREVAQRENLELPEEFMR